MERIAHRGASKSYPENTMLAFREAKKLGATAIELDVRMSLDGEVVVIHDRTVDRTHKGSGRVSQFSLEVLQSLKCKQEGFEERKDCRIPSLKEVLQEARKSHLKVYIELKDRFEHHHGLVEATLELVKACQMMYQVSIISFNKTDLKAMRIISKSIRLGFLVFYPTVLDAEEGEKLEIRDLGMQFVSATPEIIKTVKQKNFKALAYTVNQEDVMRRLIEQDIDGIITDDILLLYEVVNTL